LSTYVYQSANTVNQTASTGELTSISPVDPNYFAIARADASTGEVGIELNVDGSGTVYASAALTETWGCGGFCVLGSFPLPVFVPFSIGLEGTLSPGVTANEFGGELDIKGSTFRFFWNGTSMEGTLCNPTFTGPDCNPVDIGMTTQLDGSLLFSMNLHTVLSFDTFAFNTSLSINGGDDPTSGPINIDFLNTFRFDVFSDNPDIVWTSDSGRTSIALAPPVPSVPEPATLALLGIGLAGLGFSRRRKPH
jgi:hypothetical protein